MPRRDVTADWSIELDDSFQGRVVDGSLQFVSAGPPLRTVWLAVWSPPMSEPAESNIAWAKQTAASSGVQGPSVQEFDEPGSDADELRYGRWYQEAPEGRPRWVLNAYTARRGDLVQGAFLSDSADDLSWALTAWRSLRSRRAEEDASAGSAASAAGPAQQGAAAQGAESDSGQAPDQAPDAVASADQEPAASEATAVGAGIVELGAPSVSIAGFSPPGHPSDQAEVADGKPATGAPSVIDPTADESGRTRFETATVVPVDDVIGSAQETPTAPSEEPAPSGVPPVASDEEDAASESAAELEAEPAAAPEPEPEPGSSEPETTTDSAARESASTESASTESASTEWSATTTVVADDLPAGGTTFTATQDPPAPTGRSSAAVGAVGAVGSVGAAAAGAYAGGAQSDVEAAESARSRQLAQLGQLDPAPIPAHLNPMLRAAAVWPTPRQEFRRVRRGPWTLIASSGLSDPYADPSQTPASGRHGSAHRLGLGVEVFVEADDPALTGPIETVPANWALQLAWQAAQVVALNGLSMVDWLNEHRIGSIEFHDVAMPSAMPQFIARDGSGRPVVGALLGVDAPDVPQTMALPGGPVRMLAVTVITARELDYVRQAGAAGRQWLAGALAHSGTAHRSTLVRASLI